MLEFDGYAERDSFFKSGAKRKCCGGRPQLNTVLLGLVLFFQLVLVTIFGFIVLQVAPLKTLAEPMIAKASAVVSRIDAAEFAAAINKTTTVINHTNETEFSAALNKTMRVVDRVNETQFTMAMSKSTLMVSQVNSTEFMAALNTTVSVATRINATELLQAYNKTVATITLINATQLVSATLKASDAVNRINVSSLLSAINTTEQVTLPAINRILPVIEDRVIPTYNRLEPVIDQIPQFINETKAFIAQVRALLRRFFPPVNGSSAMSIMIKTREHPVAMICFESS